MFDARRMSLLLVLAACGRGADRTSSEPVTSEQITLALQGAFGVHPGQRRNHTKGTCALGSFVGLPAARAYSRSLMFSGEAIPVIARFSLAGGDPNAADTERSPRGMGLELSLPDGSLQHFTMLHTPMFFAATPRAFLDKMVAQKRDPTTGKADPAKLAEFVRTHHDNDSQARFLADHNPPPSYANAAYYGIHTFHFVGRDDRATSVRFRFVPDDGELELSNAELAAKPASFLEQTLIERLERGPVKWQMLVAIGEPGDSENDPTVLWPTGRKEVRAGTLTISSAAAQPGSPCERINYDPLVLADGIAPSNDPVLLSRSPSYSSSAGRRLRGL